MVAIFVLVLFLTVISVDLIVLKFQGKYHPAFAPSFSPYDLLIFNENNFTVPQDIFFSKGHTWLKTNEDGTINIGIDALGLAALGPNPVMSFVKEGTELLRGGTLMEGGQGDNKIKFLSPVKGTVKAVNKKIPGNENPGAYTIWNIQVTAEDFIENRKLFVSGKQALPWMRKEFVKLKSFLDKRTPHIAFAGVTMYDGGSPSADAVSSVVYKNAKDFEKQFLSL